MTPLDEKKRDCPRLARRSRGAAMLLVLIAVVVATILALSFLATQGPTSAVATNIDRKAKARQIAESALEMAIAYVNQDPTWRTDKVSGQWMSAAALDGGTFDLYGTDEADGDLADDDSDAVLLVVVATYQGVTHRVSARVTPGGQEPSGLVADWHALSGWPWRLDDVDWDDAPLMTTVEADINWPSTSSPWMSGLPADNFAVELTGTVTAPTSGDWTFYLNSDDGSELVIDGSQVIDNDGLHAMRERSGSVSMTGGEALPIRVRFFERSGGAGLILSWSGPGQSKQVVPASAFASAAEDAGPEPTLLALYDFQEQSVADPVLVGHWKLDEQAGGGFGGVSAGEKIDIDGSGRIASYDATLGDISSQPVTDNAVVTLNSTGSGDFKVDWSCYLGGDGYIGAGGNTSSVFEVNGTLTGSRLVQSTNLVMPALSAPSGMPPMSGDFRAKDNSRITINSDRHYEDFEITGSADVTISGHVTVWVEDDVKIKGSGELIIPEGSSLTLYCGGDFVVEGSGKANADSTATGRLTVYAYGEQDVEIKGSGIMAGTVYTNDSLHVIHSGIFYGKVLAEEEIKIDGSGRIYQDLALGGFGAGGGAMPPVADASSLDNDGTVHGGITGGADGVIGTAFDFDGDDGYVEVPHDPSYLLDAGSVGLHFYPTDLGGEQGLFSKDSSGRDNGGHLSIYTDGTRLKARIQTDGSDPYHTGDDIELASASGALSDDTWHHAMVTWGDGQFRLYLDGVLVDAANHLGGLGVTSGGSGNDEPIVLGALSDNSANQSATPVDSFFTGRIDDVRLYDLPLDAAQASNLAGGAEPGARAAPGYIALDTSGYNTPADLIVYDPAAINWIDGGGLQFTGDTLATTLGSAPKLHDAIQARGAFAVELILERATPISTASPSHIVGYTHDANTHNFMLGQDGGKYQARVRDDATGSDARLSPEFVSTSNLAGSGQTHLVLSYSEGNVSVYIDGSLDKTAGTGGTLDNWASDLLLVVGGAYSASHYWNGTIKRLAIYDDAFDATQANNVYNGEAPGSGEGGAGFVDWDEED